jgi:hypothetical protein
MFKGSPAFKKWNIARALALVALMAVGVAIYFNSVSGGAADTASQSARLRNPSLTQEQQKAADRVDQTSVHSLSEDLRIVTDDEWMYGPQDYEAALAANLARRGAEAKATVRRVEAYIARNKAYETALAANQARREAEAKATVRRVEAYIARNKAYEAALAARAPKADWPAGFLNQGRAGYSIKEQMEILEEANARGKKHTFDMVDVRHYENHEGWERGEAFQVNGHSTLVRTEDRVIGTLQTSGLEPGAWTMWWIFYNNPGECQNPLFDPKGNQLSQCSFQDRLIDEVGRSPGWGSSSVVGDNGIGNFAAVKDAGDDATGSPAEVNLCCPIVTNPLGAEIHILMRYHGPVEEANAELLLDQLFTWGGGCDYDPALNRGMPGDFDCVDPAMAVHPGSPRQDSREDDD